MAATAPPAAPKVPDKGFRLPPEEKFWKRYSPHHEFPLSAVSSGVLHGIAFVCLLIIGVLLAKYLRFDNPPNIGAVGLIDPGGGGGRPDGVGPGHGDGDPVPQGETAEQPDPKKAPPTINLPELEPGPIDPIKLPNFSDNGARVIDPGNKALQALQSLNEDARTKVFSGLAAGKGKGGSGQGGGEGTGTGMGEGAGVGNGKGKLSLRQKRVLRWTMIFTTSHGEDYARQLNGLGAMIAVPEADGQYKLFRDLSQRPVRGDLEDLAKIQSIYWVDDKRESVGGLARALGFPTPSHVVAFFPEKLENHLLELEKNYRGLKEEDIAETKFEVVRMGGNSYEPRVVSQTAARK
jgi:hypothetical protein